jgi:hypothetical protein
MMILESGPDDGEEVEILLLLQEIAHTEQTFWNVKKDWRGKHLC